MAENSAPGGTPGAITAEELTRWREVCERATGGDWAWEDGPPTVYACRDDCSHGLNLFGRLSLDTNGPANLDFVCIARHALPRLLDEVDRLRAILAEREAQTRQAVADLLREEQYSHDALLSSLKERDTENVNYFRGEEDGHAAGAWRVKELLAGWTGEDPETVQIDPTPPDAKEEP